MGFSQALKAITYKMSSNMLCLGELVKVEKTIMDVT